jgi:hypothetical protein
VLTLLKSNGTVLVVGALLLATTHFAVYQYGAHGAELACANARTEAERQTSNALVVLARQVAEADAVAEAKRTEAETLARRLREQRNAKVHTLPATDCVVDEPRRVLIGTTYCTRFPSAPSCLPGAVPAVPK